MNQERFQRTERLLGPEALAKLGAAHVAVIGLGAVGSFAVEALARTGVGHLRLVDYDIVHVSNINRQLYALESTIGKPKTELARARVQDINPACQVECLSCFVQRDTMDQVLTQPLDLVVDAIDSLSPKVALLETVQARGLPVISSMGAARHTDPQAVRTGPLSKASGCHLARMVRKWLRRRGAPVEFTCVYSVEPVRPRPKDIPSEDVPVDYLDRGRRREPLGSMPTLTGIFGLNLGHAAIRHLLGGFESYQRD